MRGREERKRENEEEKVWVLKITKNVNFGLGEKSGGRKSGRLDGS